MAYKQPEFDLSRFQATPNDIMVCIPKGLFSIHRDKNRSVHGVYLSRAKDQWWLVDARVVEREGLRIPKLWRANLFEGMMEVGTRFILPVTYLACGNPTSWSQSWDEIIPQARRRWVEAQADKGQAFFDITQDSKHPAGGLNWPDDDFEMQVHRAFHGRIISARADAIDKLQIKSCREVIEEETDD